jgi:uncharacterized protein
MTEMKRDMKRSVEHLPRSKQSQLAHVTALILAAAEVEFIILFGSHARGDWQKDLETGYESDFDILVITRNEALADKLELWSQVEADYERLPDVTELSLITHDFAFVKNKIEWGHYFFNDIRREGIVLYDSGRYTLPEPRILGAEERKEKAKEDFEKWFESANDFYRFFEFGLEHGMETIAAFQLHQATERYFTTVLLVFTNYKPRIHNIEKLGKQAADLHSAFRDIFPRETEEDNRLFDLLKKAYVDARYSKKYRITGEELRSLAKRVQVLRERTEMVCGERVGGGNDRVGGLTTRS